MRPAGRISGPCRRAGVLAAGMLAAFGYCAQVGAQDEEAAGRSERLNADSERCLSLSRIRNTEIVDDTTIIFELRGGDYYVNSLPRRCPGLKRENRFSYEVRLRQLCSTDSIRVLESFGGGLRDGPHCGLGVFVPITKEEADFIIAESNAEDTGRIETEATALPPEESADEDGAEN